MLAAQARDLNLNSGAHVKVEGEKLRHKRSSDLPVCAMHMHALPVTVYMYTHEQYNIKTVFKKYQLLYMYKSFNTSLKLMPNKHFWYNEW